MTGNATAVGLLSMLFLKLFNKDESTSILLGKECVNSLLSIMLLLGLLELSFLIAIILVIIIHIIIIIRIII